MTSLQRYIDGIPLIVIMPNGERGFYTDSHTRPNAAHETYIVQDIVGFVDRTFNTIPEAGGRAAAGLSMGGYGAVKLALKYSQVFSAAASLSGALAFAHTNISRDENFELEFRHLVGDNPVGGDNDLFALASAIPIALRPPLFISCGIDDFLIDHNRSFVEHLTTLGFPHKYEDHPGVHNWNYWNKHIVPAIEYLAKPLGLGDLDLSDRI
jgi:S-formylglutathione hydrolase FrmB